MVWGEGADLLGLLPVPPPCQKWHRGGNLKAAHDLVLHGVLESEAPVIPSYLMRPGPLLCGISAAEEGQGGGQRLKVDCAARPHQQHGRLRRRVLGGDKPRTA